MRELVRRYERLRTQKVDPRDDNALAITTNGRKLATDARKLSATAPDFPESKVNRLVDNVAATWNRTAESRGTQMIFADMGVNPTGWGYSPYEEIINKLVAYGIPRNQIAAIGDAESDAKKQALFEKVRNGSVRVLIGSTQKMGTGTNVQKRLVALHHLDAPWKPAEVEQRDGRILRQGNENEEVAIYRYVTEGSFDAYMWQALETKAKFISQVMTGDNASRRAEDIGGLELSYAEVKAIASGNPAVLTLAEADAELQRLTLLKKNHLDEQYVARRSVRDLPGSINALSDRLGKICNDEAVAKARIDDPISIGSRTYPREDIMEVLCKKLDALPKSVREPTRVPLGHYRGLRFGLMLDGNFPPEVFLEGATTRMTSLSREHQGPRAVINALERLVTAYGTESERVQQDLDIAEAQLRDYQTRLGNPFTLEAYLTEVTGLRDKLKAALSGVPPQPDKKEEGLSISELAERIKTLKSSQTIESAPQRTRQKHSSAVEPVTSLIRRQAGGIPDKGTSFESDDAASSKVDPIQQLQSAKNSSTKSPLAFEERIAIERQSRDTAPQIL